MKNNKLFLIAALLGTTLVACQKEKDIQKPEEQKPILEKGWTLMVNATMDPDTKAMSLAGTTLKTYWEVGETVNVFLNGTLLGELEVTETTNEGNSATLIGRIPADNLNVGSSLTLLAPGRDDHLWTYLGQDGTAPAAASKLATHFDYAKATLSVSDLDATNNVIVVSATANFTTEQSVYRFGFTGGPSSVKEFTLFSSAGQLALNRTYGASDWESELGTSLTVTPSAPGSDYFFVAIRNESTVADKYTFNVVDNNGALYEGAKNIPAAALTSYRYLNATVSLTQKALAPAASGTISTVNEVL